jgi:hypothetical protein
VVASDFPFRDVRPARGVPDVQITRSHWPFPPLGTLVREVRNGTDAPTIQVFESEHGLQYHAWNIGRFWIEASGKHIWYSPEPGAREADIEQMLVGPVLGLALLRQGQLLLHAGAVAVAGRAVAFSAPSGLGKSTLAASFVRAGYPLISDDLLPLVRRADGFAAAQSVPRIKLWTDSLDALGEDAGRYDLVLSGLEKRRVPIDDRWGSVAPASLPLAAFYFLTPHRDTARPVTVEPVEALPATLTLAASVYMAEVLRGPHAARALDAVADLARQVPIRRVSYCRDYGVLPALRAALLAGLVDRDDTA